MRPLHRLVGALLIATTVFAACSSDDSSSSATDAATSPTTGSATTGPGTDATTGETDPATTAGGDEQPADLIPLTVGATRAVSNVSLAIGIDQGFFEEEGIDLSLEWAQSGAAVVPSVLNGEFDFGETNVSSLMIARSNDIPITGIMAAASAATDPDLDTMGVLVLKDSPIEEPADLIGKTIAINALGGIGDITLRASFVNLGLDPDGFKFVEMPFGDMAVALTEHRVDAIWQTETYLTPTLDVARVVLPTAVTAHPGLQFGLLFTSNKNLAEHPDVVAAFRRAMTKSLNFTQDNPELVREYFTTVFGVDADVAQRVRLLQWKPELDTESIDLWAKWLVEFGFLDGPVDTTDLIVVD